MAAGPRPGDVPGRRDGRHPEPAERERQFGYEVVVPFRLDGGPVLLVDRGWIPNGAVRRAARRRARPAPGEVTVVARLRPTEPPVPVPLPAGQAERIDVPRSAAAVGGPAVTGAYAVLAQEQPAARARLPALIPRPDEDLGPHLAYAVQWWLGAVAVVVLLVVYAGKGGAHPDGACRRRRRPRGGPPPIRRSGHGAGELTDEEWEDLADTRLQARVGEPVVGGRPGVDDHDPGVRTPGDVDE